MALRELREQKPPSPSAGTMTPQHFALASLLPLAATAPLVVLSQFKMPVMQWRYIGVAVALFILSSLSLYLPVMVPVFQLGHYAWTGKIISAGVVYIVLLNWRSAAPGREYLTITQRIEHPRTAALSGVLLAVIPIALWLRADSPTVVIPGWEQLLFQATLPGIDEEACFRAGIMGCLLAAFRNDPKNRADYISAAIRAVTISSALFGFAHGLSIDHRFEMHFNLFAVLLTGTVGALLAMLTISTGSIVLPIVAHNLLNVVLSFQG
ncbi:CPBP family intramembrane glutamic endopeptidase [Pandoraea pneumonica]|uniref:CPBP family intramembrane glutamic endopeptidase n=1 Tax=Pandoraea pneumonica TaxID=2508299 RepID=UPI003CE6A082